MSAEQRLRIALDNVERLDRLIQSYTDGFKRYRAERRVALKELQAARDAAMQTEKGRAA